MFKERKNRERYNLLQVADLSPVDHLSNVFQSGAPYQQHGNRGGAGEGWVAEGGLWGLWKRWPPDRGCQ